MEAVSRPFSAIGGGHGANSASRASNSRRSRLAWCRSWRSGCRPRVAPVFHLANGAAMFSLLLSGGSNVIIKAFSPAAVMEAVERNRVTEVLLVPTMIQMLVDHPEIRSHDLSSLQRIAYGASSPGLG